jgi:hypothetical protein
VRIEKVKRKFLVLIVTGGGGGSRGGPDPPILCLSAKRGLLSAYLTFGYSVDKNGMRIFKNTVKCQGKNGDKMCVK